MGGGPSVVDTYEIYESEKGKKRQENEKSNLNETKQNFKSNSLMII